MAVPHVSTNFGDLLDTEFRRIFTRKFRELPDMIPTVFNTDPGGPRGDSVKMSDVGDFDDFTEFTGSVPYDSLNQGYDVTATHVEFASGMQVERKLFDDDRYDVMNQRPAKLGTAATRTRQKHAASLFNNVFSVDTTFFTHTEGVALCSNSHTTTSGASTSAGFDNLGTSALAATAVITARKQMRGYRNDQGGRVSIMPDELWYPVDVYDKAEEIIRSSGKPDTANNNVNVSQGVYTGRDWEYLTDANNWFMADSTKRKETVFWFDRIPIEFAFAEDLDTIIAKWRAYMRYSFLYQDWRWIFGANVS